MRPTRPPELDEPTGPVAPDVEDPPADELEAPAPPARKGRGAPADRPTVQQARKGRGIKGHTVYLPNDLFERITVQALRKDKTISEYLTVLLRRYVPDHLKGPTAADDAA
jgi:hypothetical protein